MNMKITLCCAAAVAAMFALSACSGKAKQENAAESSNTPAPTRQETYAGIVPAADARGIQYTVVLDYTGDNAGQYDLTQVYMKGDSTSQFKSSGKFAAGKDTTSGKQYIKLAGQSPTEDVYFVVATDSTIVMADATLATPDIPGMNYTLTAVN